jgi:stage V sporulation protein R
MEFLQSHTNVVHQPLFDSGHFGGINPYALGFGMMQDIARIAVDPSEEDREWFPDIAGRGDPDEVLKDIWANYRDESFVSQFLSPRLIRTWKMFKLSDTATESAVRVDAIHNERGYREIRRALGRHYDIGWQEPDIQIVDVDMTGDRRLILEHNVVNGILLADGDVAKVMQHLADLWGYEVCLNEVNREGGSVLKQHKAQPRPAGAA